MTITLRPAFTIVVFICCAGFLIAACGGSSGSPSNTASAVSPSATMASPTARPSPQVTSGLPPAGAVAVVRQYWTLLGEQSYGAAHALTTGHHIGTASIQSTGIDSARYLRPAGKVFPTPGDDATVEFGSRVRIVPTATGSPFGTTPRRWLMFSRVVRMSDDSWRLVELGTGP